MRGGRTGNVGLGRALDAHRLDALLGDLPRDAGGTVVYGWLPSRTAYLGLALGLATLMTIGAIAGRAPMMGAKIGMNYLVALVFGLLLPRPVAVG